MVTGIQRTPEDGRDRKQNWSWREEFIQIQECNIKFREIERRRILN